MGPTSEIWNKLAIRTWFDPSLQVVSYVYTTLKNIAELPNHSHPYTYIGEKAREALKLAKPQSNLGWETSRNNVIFQFLDNLKASVNLQLQYINTPETIIPKNWFWKQTVKTETHRMEYVESSVYVQGAEYFLNKAYEAYNSMMTGEDKSQYDANKNYIRNILRVENRVAMPPAAHMSVKVLGLQRFFSIDATMIEQIIETVTRDAMEALNKDHSLTKEFVKIIDLVGHRAVIPTETGLPLHLHHATPLVVSGKASLNVDLKSMTEGRVGLTMKPVVNYKQSVTAHVICPFTGKFLGSGVDTALHVTLPLSAEIAMQNGQYTVTIRTPEDRESQRTRPLVALRVRPYTTIYDMASSIPPANAANTKVIRMASPLKRKEVNIGRHLGLSLMLDVETQQPFADFAEIVHTLKNNNILTLLSLPLPLKTVRETTMKIVYNPAESVTKAASFAIEMMNFVDMRHEEGTGAGHNWVEVGTHNPTWCDLCGELIWGLYAVGAWQCTNCGYYSHIKCRDKVLLDCRANLKVDEIEEPAEEVVSQDDTDGQVASLCRDCPGASRVSTLTSAPSYRTARSDFSLPLLSVTDSTVLSDSESEDQFHTLHNVRSITNTDRDEFHTLKDVDTLTGGDDSSEDEFHTLANVKDISPDKQAPPASLLSLPPEELITCINRYNACLPPAQHCVWDPELSLYNGYIRVDMNLARPINVISGSRPPSTYNIETETSTINDRTLTTFYLPPGTERALHITSQTTTQDVIKVLLRKFRVADNPHKYALYERQDDYRGDSFPRSKSLSRLRLRRLQEDEKPLVLAVLWGRTGGGEGRKFVLQENDPGEIEWEQFSLPELKNFLLILDREEAWYKRRIHEKYETVQEEILRLLHEKNREEAEKEY